MSEWKGMAEVPIVYDAEAILYEWDKLKAEIAGAFYFSAGTRNARRDGGALAQASNLVIGVSQRDARILQHLGVASVAVLGFESTGIFIVPTRHCAVISYKAYEAAAHDVPLVVTPIICDQLGWIDNKDCLVGANAKELTDKCITLYSDESLWNTLRENALD